MQVVFIGVGEAFDEHLGNTSLLVSARGGQGAKSILLDCGFNAPFAYWRMAEDPMALDAVWISHFHGDHFMGLPALLLRFHEQGRTDPLLVLGGEGVAEKVPAAMELAYPGLVSHLGYPLELVDVMPGTSIEVLGLSMSFALTGHGRPCLGLRLMGEGGCLYYGGDGPPLEDGLELARGCDLVVQEGFDLDGETPGHGTVQGAVDFASRAGAMCLAVVHVNRVDRHTRRGRILDILDDAPMQALLPEPGLVLTPCGDKP